MFSLLSLFAKKPDHFQLLKALAKKIKDTIRLDHLYEDWVAGKTTFFSSTTTPKELKIVIGLDPFTRELDEVIKACSKYFRNQTQEALFGHILRELVEELGCTFVEELGKFDMTIKSNISGKDHNPFQSLEEAKKPYLIRENGFHGYVQSNYREWYPFIEAGAVHGVENGTVSYLASFHFLLTDQALKRKYNIKYSGFVYGVDRNTLSRLNVPIAIYDKPPVTMKLPGLTQRVIDDMTAVYNQPYSDSGSKVHLFEQGFKGGKGVALVCISDTDVVIYSQAYCDGDFIDLIKSRPPKVLMRILEIGIPILKPGLTEFDTPTRHVRWYEGESIPYKHSETY